MRSIMLRLGAQSAFRRRDSWLCSAAVVTILAACVYLMGIAAVPVTDRDEPRFAQASRQMAEGDELSDWIVPRVGEQIRLKKPPLIYWLQAPTAMAAASPTANSLVRDDSIWMYRLPSALAALTAALATLWLGRAMFGGNVGLLAACLLVVSPVIVTDCHMARADEVLLACTTLAMCLLWKLWRAHRVHSSARGGLPLGFVVLFWLCIGLGVLAKGPITPFVAGTCAFGLACARREWRFLWRLRPFTGVFVLAALALPWLWLAMREVGLDTLRAAFEKEVLLRAREGAEGHAAPPGYYLVTLVVFFFPGSLLTALAFGRTITRAFMLRCAANAAINSGLWTRTRARLVSTDGRDAELFLLCFAVPTWLAFELIVTKFPHYILPIYPAIALFTARAVLGGARAFTKPINAVDRFGFGAWFIVGLVLTIAGPTLYFVLLALGKTAPAMPSWPVLTESSLAAFAIATIAVAAAIALLTSAWRAALAHRFARAMTLAIPATALAEMALFTVWIPNTHWIWNTPRIVGLVVEDCKKTPLDADFPLIAGIGYGEDSLLWTTRNRLVRFGDKVTDDNREAIHTWCKEHPGAYLLLPRATVETFAQHGTVVGELRGFNYSDGDPVDHAIMRIER